MKAMLSAEMTKKKKQTVTESIKKYGSQLFGFIQSKVTNSEDAKDILQDVWYQFSRLTNLDEIENVSGWLYNVSRNRITDNYRKKKTASLEDFTVEGEDGELSVIDILLVDDSNNPELGLFKEVFWDALLKALDELPESQRSVFVLNELEDVTLKEISELQGENIKTIISRKGYAVKHLRKKLNFIYQEINN
ncbi:MAG: RNA polymerase sigma factor (sigma-70 family) [Bacteroidia bacterium]|jgi:RNA polymerase sigma factor (sigma-70 family)